MNELYIIIISSWSNFTDILFNFFFLFFFVSSENVLVFDKRPFHHDKNQRNNKDP